MSGKYDDIIHLPHPVSKKHPPMKAMDRAAQFSPFAALTGHGAAIKETARLTDERIELDGYMKDILSHRLQIASDFIKEEPEISITYFKPDAEKQGGAYIVATGSLKKIDEYERALLMDDGSIIPIDEIISIEGEIFERFTLYNYPAY